VVAGSTLFRGPQFRNHGNDYVELTVLLHTRKMPRSKKGRKKRQYTPVGPLLGASTSPTDPSSGSDNHFRTSERLSGRVGARGGGRGRGRRPQGRTDGKGRGRGQSNRRNRRNDLRTLLQPTAADEGDFVQANFKLLLNYGRVAANPRLEANLRQCLSNPDELLDWRSVHHLVSLVSPCAGDDCPICLDGFAAPHITPCGHTFCVTCISRYLESATATQLKKNVPLPRGSSDFEHPCPVCKAQISSGQLRGVTLLEPFETQRPVSMSGGRRQASSKQARLHASGHGVFKLMVRRGSHAHIHEVVDALSFNDFEEQSSAPEVPAEGKDTPIESEALRACKTRTAQNIALVDGGLLHSTSLARLLPVATHKQSLSQDRLYWSTEEFLQPVATANVRNCMCSCIDLVLEVSQHTSVCDSSDYRSATSRWTAHRLRRRGSPTEFLN